jgi:acetylornithine deacetylase
VSRAYQLIQQKQPQLAGESGWLDSALLAEAGIPVVIFGPAGEGAHAAVEYVDIASVVTTTRC